MLRRIRINNFKSFKNLEISFGDFVVLCGPNGTGKSNFLDLLFLLSKIATLRTLKDAFEPPFRGKPLEAFGFSEGGISKLLEQEASSFSVEVDVELSDSLISRVNSRIQDLRQSPSLDMTQKGATVKKSGPMVREKHLRYCLTIEIVPRKGILRVRDEALYALSRDGSPKKSRNAYFETEGQRISLRMEGQAHPRYFETGLNHTILSMPHYAPHYPHLTAMREELESWRFFYFEPRERMRFPSPLKVADGIGLMGEDLAAFLHTIKNREAGEIGQFSSIEKTLKTLIPAIRRLDTSVNDIGEVEIRLFEEGIPLSARLISEGTIRILGLLSLCSVSPPPPLLGIEEPETGIHPRRIRQIAEILQQKARSGKSQIIVTTHSLLFLDAIHPESIYLCRKIQGESQIEKYQVEGKLCNGANLEKALNGDSPPPEDTEKVSVSDRVLRGDFDG